MIPKRTSTLTYNWTSYAAGTGTGAAGCWREFGAKEQAEG